MNEIETLRKLLNDKLDQANNEFNKIHSFNNKLNTIKDKTNNMSLGGIKINKVNDSIINLTEFLSGAFKEINKSVENLNNNLSKVKK